MKKILVPCDFSKQSQEAFKMAVDIAVKTKGEIVVLHAIYVPAVYNPGVGGEVSLAADPVFLSNTEEDAKKWFEKMKQEVKSPGVETRLEIVYGDILSVITSAIETTKTDLVVMGTSGTSGLREIFIGSNTEKVVRHSSVPVLTVHTASRIDSMKKILLPSTLMLDQTDFMNKVKELQKFLHATLYVLFINTPDHFVQDSEAQRGFEKFVKHYNIKNCIFLFKNYQDEEKGIMDVARNEEPGLIVMATHARKGLAHLFNRSITENLVNHIRYPVWTYGMKKSH